MKKEVNFNISHSQDGWCEYCELDPILEDYGNRNDVTVVIEAAVFEGKEGKRTADGNKGFFKCVYSTGDVYTGNFIQNERNGPGLMLYANGDEYRGQWLNNMFDGDGELLLSSGIYYRGDFRKHTINGDGVMHYSNGDRYEGSWYLGKRHSHGVMKYFNGDVYSGNWKDDLRSGTLR
eukprot:TRINITY_DN5532_c0_g1_i1.p1 TRINITY_DN5532_c0_g1~~TRINITY_DN5532_c0_g1_i1.p1  ORF type:complete len:185 (+),score=31.36 TRINITY_DN5532_c0_g1_i1:25-555(+)